MNYAQISNLLRLTVSMLIVEKNKTSLISIRRNLLSSFYYMVAVNRPQSTNFTSKLPCARMV